MIKIVLDSNVYISAALYGGTPRNLFRMITKDPLFLLFVSSKIQEEVLEVLKEKFSFTEQKLKVFSNLA